MKLVGVYDSSNSYSVGDVVKYTDGVVYWLQRPAPSGTPPTDTRFWGKVGQNLAEAVDLIIDFVGDTGLSVANNLTTTASGKVLDARQGKKLKDLIDALTERVAALEPAAEGGE